MATMATIRGALHLTENQLQLKSFAIFSSSSTTLWKALATCPSIPLSEWSINYSVANWHASAVVGRWEGQAEEEEEEEEPMSRAVSQSTQEEGGGVGEELEPGEEGEEGGGPVQTPALRFDALDRDRDFTVKRGKPSLRIDYSRRHVRSGKPGKKQNVPPKARQMIMHLHSLDHAGFLAAMKQRAKALRPNRADWLYVIRFFQEREDKSFLLQVFDFVLLEKSFEASLRDYTNLMLVYIELEKYEAVEQTLKVMIERKLYPDLAVYTVLISMYGKIGCLGLAMDKFREMNMWDLVPDTRVYCALIEVFSQQGKPKEAEAFLIEAEGVGLSLDIQMFVSLIRGYGNVGLTKDAERVFQLMQLKRIYPERRSYSALMDAYTKDDDLDHAMQVFENMLSIKVKPTDKSMARLLLVCENNDMIEKATYLLEKLESQYFKLGTKTLLHFNDWLEKLGLEKEVEELSGELSKRMWLRAKYRRR